jgi:Stage II sporulation protein E (SpoIIE)
MPLRDAQGKIIGTFGISRDITAKKRAAEKLARLTEELRAKNESLEQDLEMARELQSSLLPQRFPNFPHHANHENSAVHFYPFFRPSMIVSGDFFDVFDISDEKAGLFICDVMGHGVRAALVAAIVRSVVTELRPLWTRPGELLIALNRALLATFRNSETMLLLRHVTSWPTLPGASCATPMPVIRIHSASRAQPTGPDQQPRPSTGDEDRALLWVYSRARSTRLSVVSSPRTTLCSCSRTASSKSKARKANSTTISSS